MGKKSDPVCRGYAEETAREVGFDNYRQAQLKYPESTSSVYLNACETLEGNQHCVHCARADAMLRYGKFGRAAYGTKHKFKIRVGIVAEFEVEAVSLDQGEEMAMNMFDEMACAPVVDLEPEIVGVELIEHKKVN